MLKSSIIHLPHHKQEYGASCLPVLSEAEGAACVVMVLSHWQVEVAEAEVRRIIRTKPYSGTHPVNLIHLSELGFVAWPYEGTVEGVAATGEQRDAGHRVPMDGIAPVLG